MVRVSIIHFFTISEHSDATLAFSFSVADRGSRCIYAAVRYCPKLSCRPLAILRRSSSCKVSIRALRLRADSSACLRAVISVFISSQPTGLSPLPCNVVQRLTTVSCDPSRRRCRSSPSQTQRCKKHPLGIQCESIPEWTCQELLPWSSRKDAPHLRSSM
jgi:hypothetical protein